MLPRAIGAAPRDLDRVVDAPREDRRTARSSRAVALEIMLGAQAPALIDGDIASFGDADERVMRLEIVGALEIGLVGGDDREIGGIGKIEQKRLDRPLLRQSVPLQLDIEAVAEDALAARRGGRGRGRDWPGGEREVDDAFRAAGERDEAVAPGRRGGGWR